MIKLGHLIHLGVHCSHPVAKGTASVVVISGEADAGSGQYHFGDRLLMLAANRVNLPLKIYIWVIHIGLALIMQVAI